MLGPRAVQRLKKGLRWPKEEYDGVNKDPHSIYAAMDPERLVPNPDAKDDGAPVAEPGRRLQNVQIRMADWMEHGSTSGYSKCTSALELDWGVYGGSHSKACLERYRDIYAGSKEGRIAKRPTQDSNSKCTVCKREKLHKSSCELSRQHQPHVHCRP